MYRRTESLKIRRNGQRWHGRTESMTQEAEMILEEREQERGNDVTKSSIRG